MAGIGNIFEIGRRALSAQQAALDRTSHNIANVNTEGYSRQRVVMRAEESLYAGRRAMAGGVDASAIERIKDKFVEKQIQFQLPAKAWYETLKTGYARLEEIINEPSEYGLGTALTQFFDAWHELANEPDSLAMRNNVLMRTRALTRAFHQTTRRIDDLKLQARDEFHQNVSRFNELAEQAAKLNREISLARAGNVFDGELMDKRDRILRELSEIADVQATEDQNGLIMLSLDGKIFVQNVDFVRLVDEGSDAELGRLRWEDGGDPFAPRNGRLAALAEWHDVRLDEVQQDLDTLASELAGQVNALHIQGYTKEKAPARGVPFFDPESVSARDIRLADEVQDDPDRIAASMDGSSGNGEVALRIAQLQNENILNGGLTRFQDFYANVAATVGTSSQQFASMAEGQELFLQQLTAHQEAISGVSLDEEMTNLIEFQRAYQAAARVVNVANDMIETLLNTV